MMYRNWHAPYLAKVSTAHSKIKSSCSRYSFPQNFQILKQIFFPQKVKILKANAEIQGRHQEINKMGSKCFMRKSYASLPEKSRRGTLYPRGNCILSPRLETGCFQTGHFQEIEAPAVLGSLKTLLLRTTKPLFIPEVTVL